MFGHDDELKVAPKGIDKNHKSVEHIACPGSMKPVLILGIYVTRDIDLLKLRSIAVVHKYV